MTKSIYRTLLAVSFTAFAFVGCDKYDTLHETGTSFAPYNSLVARFTHPVYIEYKGGQARVWGPYADEVVIESCDGARLSLSSEADSVALFVYGNAMGDSLAPLHGQLNVTMQRDFALYLNGLYLRSQQGPALSVHAPKATCYMVLPAKSINQLADTLYSPYSDPLYNACIWIDGTLYLNGTGSISVRNVAPPMAPDAADSLPSHAIWTSGSVLCNYSIQATLISKHGYAIRTDGSDVLLAKGTWHLYAGCDTLSALHDSLLVSLKEVKAHHDSVAKVYNAYAKDYNAVLPVYQSLLAAADTVQSDSLQYLLDSVGARFDSLYTGATEARSLLAADTLQLNYYTMYTDSLLRHRAIYNDGANILLGEEAKLNVYASPDSIK